jgi:hypothetical protein
MYIQNNESYKYLHAKTCVTETCSEQVKEWIAQKNIWVIHAFYYPLILQITRAIKPGCKSENSKRRLGLCLVIVRIGVLCPPVTDPNSADATFVNISRNINFCLVSFGQIKCLFGVSKLKKKNPRHPGA